MYEAHLRSLLSPLGIYDLEEHSASGAAVCALGTGLDTVSRRLEEIERENDDMREWYRITFHRLIEICRLVSSKYTRSKVRKAMPREYAYIIDEMLHTHYEDNDKRDYYENIISTIIDIGRASNFLVQLCELIKRLAVDHLHVVGDIFDRGPRADIILDSLLDYHSVDIQWGNHDVLWMGAASGSRTLVATVLANSLRYNNLEVIETGYGISLRPLSVFANEVYRDTDVTRFSVKLTGEEAERYTEKDVIEASGIQLGDNLFLLNKYEAARSIAEQLPYIDIEDIRIRRELPDTLLIDVAECGTPLAVIQDGSAWLLSPKGKIVEQLPASQAGDYAVIDGCELLAPSVGTDIALSTEFANQQTSLLALLAALDAAGLTDRVDAIHLDDLSRLTMDYAGRFSVEMEYNADYDRMLQILEAGISKLESNQTGSIRLDLNPPILTLD